MGESEEKGLQSMTGYGSGSAAFDGREFTVELKSVNHRFLDINIRMPRTLLFLEDALRKLIAQYIIRGHIEVSVTYRNTREDSKIISVDQALVHQYAAAFEQLQQMGFEYNIRVADVCRLPDVLTITQCEEDQPAIIALMTQAVTQACTALNTTRHIEGEKIGADLKQKLENILALAKQIETLSQNTLEEYSLKLRKRLEELLGEYRLDEQRLYQEIAVYADKIAIDEELVRIDTHVKNMLEYMDSDEAVGRKMDFFIQELNREINTIGSKSVNAEIAKLVVGAKGEVEKLREQIQNIE